jgi:hypothetical protein
MNGGSFVDNLWKNINDVQALHGNIFKSHDKSSHVIISKSFHCLEERELIQIYGGWLIVCADLNLNKEAPGTDMFLLI